MLGGLYPPYFSKSRTLSPKAIWVENSCITSSLRMFQVGQPIPCTYNEACFLDHIILEHLMLGTGEFRVPENLQSEEMKPCDFVSSNMAARKKQTILDMNCFLDGFQHARFFGGYPSYTFQLVDLSCFFQRNTRKVPYILTRYPSSHSHGSGKWVLQH